MNEALDKELQRLADCTRKGDDPLAVLRLATAGAEKAFRDLAQPLLAAVTDYNAASVRREHLGSYGFRIQDAAQDFARALSSGSKPQAPDGLPFVVTCLDEVQSTLERQARVVARLRVEVQKAIPPAPKAP